MKASVIRELTNDELFERLEMEAEGYRKMKMNHAVSQLENPLVLKSKRKVIARLNTEIRNRELVK
jgi:large subunit ribosomal protein L29